MISVLHSVEEPFELAVDIEVAAGGKRWSATVFTPEQIRECLTRWAVSGENLDGKFFWVPDGIVVPEATLSTIREVVRAHLDGDGSLGPPFQLLEG